VRLSQQGSLWLGGWVAGGVSQFCFLIRESPFIIYFSRAQRLLLCNTPLGLGRGEEGYVGHVVAWLGYDCDYSIPVASFGARYADWWCDMNTPTPLPLAVAVLVAVAGAAWQVLFLYRTVHEGARAQQADGQRGG
jgi:hypothetical protein